MIKKSFVYIIGQGIASIISFILLPWYTRYLSPEEYGFVALFLITIAFSTVFLSFGLNTSFMIKYYKSTEYQKKKLFTFVLSAYLVVIPITVILSPFSSMLKPILGEDVKTYHFLLFGLIILFSLYNQFFLALLRNQLKATLYVIFSIGNSLVIGILNLLFIIKFDLSYWSFFYSNLISNFIFMIVGIFYYQGYFTKINFCKDISDILTLFKIGWPIIPSQVSSMVLTSGDRYVLKSLIGENAVGIYSIGYRFGSLIQSFIIGPLFSSYCPVAYDLFVKNISKFKEVQKNYLILYVLILVSLILFASIFFEHLFQYIIDERYWGSYKIIGPILLSVLFIGIIYFQNIVQTMFEKLYYSMWVTMIGAALNIGLNYILIPVWGVNGAAFTTFVCYFLMMISSIIINNRMLKIEYNWGKVTLIIAIGIIGVVLQHTVNVQDIYLSVCVKGLLAMFCMFILYIFNRSLINTILSKVINKIL